MQKFLLFLGRAFFGAIFINSGIFHLVGGKAPVGYAQSKGVPMPEISVPFSGGMLLTGMFGIISGLFPRLGAAMLATFLVTTNYFMHAFWKVEDPQQKQQEMTHFMKNTSLLGATIAIAVLDKAVVNPPKAN